MGRGWGIRMAGVGGFDSEALVQSVPSRKQILELSRELRGGMTLEIEKLSVWL